MYNCIYQSKLETGLINTTKYTSPILKFIYLLLFYYKKKLSTVGLEPASPVILSFTNFAFYSASIHSFFFLNGSFEENSILFWMELFA